MKSLTNYIKEACSSSSEPCTKEITFNLTGIEGVDEFIKSLSEKGNRTGSIMSVDGNNVTLALNSETLNKAKDDITTIKDFVKDAGKSAKRASDEQYAQKLSSIEAKVKELDEFVDSCNDNADNTEKKGEEE